MELTVQGLIDLLSRKIEEEEVSPDDLVVVDNNFSFSVVEADRICVGEFHRYRPGGFHDPPPTGAFACEGDYVFINNGLPPVRAVLID